MDEDLEVLFNIAYDAFGATHNTADAFEVIPEEICKSNTFKQLAIERVKLAVETGNDAKIRGLVAFLVSLRSDFWKPLYELAVFCNDNNLLDQAVSICSELIKTFPSDPFLRYNLALALYKLHRTSEALTEVEGALTIMHDDWRPNILAGRCYGDLASSEKVKETQSAYYEKAAMHYKIALAKDSDRTLDEYRFRYGCVLNRTKRYAMAESQLEQYLKFNPDHIDAHIQYIIALRNQGKFAKLLSASKIYYKLKKERLSRP